MSTTERRWSGALADGAEWEVAAPPEWNGGLILEADLWTSERDDRLYGWLAGRGYARARLAREVHAWDLPRTMDHLAEVHGIAERILGTPERTLVWGRSLGSLTARLAVESGAVPAVGAIAVDGGGMGARGPMDAGADARFVLRTLLSADDEERVGLDASADSARPVIERWAAHPHGRARLAFAAAMRGTPESSPSPDRQMSERIDDVVAALSIDLVNALGSRDASIRYADGDYTDNTRYDYARALQDSPLDAVVRAAYELAGLGLDAELTIIEGAPRHEGDEAAAAWVARHGAVTGDVPVPVLAVKGLHDPASVPAEESVYAELVARAGRAELYRWLHTDAPGHVGQSALEFAVAFDLLLERVDSGRWPGTDVLSLGRRADRVAGGAGGALLHGDGRLGYSFVEADTPLHPRYLQDRERSRTIVKERAE